VRTPVRITGTLLGRIGQTLLLEPEKLPEH
jgi:hypothetical protein